MRPRTLVLPVLVVFAAAVAGCGGSSKVSSSSLRPRLLPASAVPGFGLERTLDWSDPVNLIGEGVQLPQVTHPTDAVKKFKDAHFEGAAGEVLRRGAGLNATEARLGVAKFKSADDALAVRSWMHSQDLQQPCFSECAFNPRAATVPGVPQLGFVIQTASAPPGPPPGAPKPPAGARVATGPNPANYLAEFTVGRYLYWIALGADSTAKTQVEAGIKAYYAHAKRLGP